MLFISLQGTMDALRLKFLQQLILVPVLNYYFNQIKKSLQNIFVHYKILLHARLKNVICRGVARI